MAKIIKYFPMGSCKIVTGFDKSGKEIAFQGNQAINGLTAEQIKRFMESNYIRKVEYEDDSDNGGQQNRGRPKGKPANQQVDQPVETETETEDSENCESENEQQSEE